MRCTSNTLVQATLSGCRQGVECGYGAWIWALPLLPLGAPVHLPCACSLGPMCVRSPFLQPRERTGEPVHYSPSTGLAFGGSSIASEANSCGFAPKPTMGTGGPSTEAPNLWACARHKSSLAGMHSTFQPVYALPRLLLSEHKGGVPCAVRALCTRWRALCEKLAVLHHREFGKFRRLKGRH